jgi:cobalt-zinc-cadmium efflux system outer membrane protein
VGHSVCCVLICCIAASGVAFAQSDLPGSSDSTQVAPPIEELVALALRSSPAVAAMEERAVAARELVAPAGALPDPTLEVMVQNEGFPEWTVGEMQMSMIGPQVTQDIPFPGKRGARRAAAREEARVRDRELDALRRDVARDVREIYGQLYALDQETATLAAGRELLELLSTTVTHHQSLGESDQEAAFKARLARSKLEERIRDLAAERQETVASLNALLDRAGNAPLGVVTSLPRLDAPSTAWDSLALLGSSDIAVRQAEMAVAEKRLRTAKLDLRPDLMAGVGVGFRGDLDPVVNLRLGLEIPLWAGSKQKPLIRAAHAELEASRHDLRGAEAEARAKAASLLADYARTEEQIIRYEESFVPQTSLAFDAARSAYVGARGDFSTVIEDLNLWLEARAGLARREADRFIVLARLDFLTTSAPGSGTEEDFK